MGLIGSPIDVSWYSVRLYIAHLLVSHQIIYVGMWHGKWWHNLSCSRFQRKTTKWRWPFSKALIEARV